MPSPSFINTATIHSQPGPARTKEDTKVDILEQLRLACNGVEARVTEHQKGTGTKDRILQYWLPEILAKSKEVRLELRRSAKALKIQESRDEFMNRVEKAVLEWAKSLLNPLFNALFTVDGKYFTLTTVFRKALKLAMPSSGASSSLLRTH